MENAEKQASEKDAKTKPETKTKAEKPKGEAGAAGDTDAKTKPETKVGLFVDEPVEEGRLLPAVGLATIRVRDPKQAGYVVLGRMCSHAKPLRIRLEALTFDQRRDLPLDRCIDITVEE